MRGPMNFKLKSAAAALVAVALVASSAYASDPSDRDPNAPAKKKTHATEKKQTCEACDEIQALKKDMQDQIDALKSDLANKSVQLQQARQAAADAQAAADRATAAATASNQAVVDNTSAVNTLQQVRVPLSSAHFESLSVLGRPVVIRPRSPWTAPYPPPAAWRLRGRWR